MVASPEMVKTIVPIQTHEIGQSVVVATGLSARGPSPSSSLSNRSRGDNSSTPSKGHSPKRAHLMDDDERVALTPFFRLPAILHSRVPRAPKEFTIVVAAEDLDFIRDLSATERRGFFAYASCTLFRVRTLISIVVVDQDDVLGFSEISREQDDLGERCEVLEQQNYDAEKELSEL